MKLIELIERSAARFEGAGVCCAQGTTNAFDEAAWLVLWRLKLPLGALDEHAEQDIGDADEAAVEALITQRIETRRPAAYLTGEAWLQGAPFTVDERVIIPRSLIAVPLVEGTLDAWMRKPPRTVLDLCTGSACLAVLAAQAWPDAAVQGTDLSADALAVARINIERHGLAPRIALRQGDGLTAARGRFDLILCNPPYVNAQSMAALPPEFLAEPALALAGGEDGMSFIRGLLAGVRRHLNDTGILVLEIGNEREHFEAAFPGMQVVWLSTSAGDDQVLLIEAGDLT